MTKYNFDAPIERHNTNSVKFDALEQHFGSADLIPLWVADTDFATPDFIRNAVFESLRPMAWGYHTEDQRWRPAIINWLANHYGWKVDKDWLAFIPGIVKGIGIAVNFLTSPGDEVIIQTPVYHPFRNVPEALGRKIVENPLSFSENGEVSMDLDHLENLETSAKLLILANPHNPIGKVWPREQLERLAEICHRRGITVISDEIHADMVLPGKPAHSPFASVSPKAAEISITFGSPSKAFNIPGLATSFAVVPNPELRKKFFGGMEALEFNSASCVQEAAVIAAYNQGEEWLRQMLRYVAHNIQFVKEYCEQYLPAIKVVEPDASFLVWLDCRELNLNHDKLQHLFIRKAGLALNDGEIFGKQGAGFMRLNVGTQRAVLEKALNQLREQI